MKDPRGDIRPKDHAEAVAIFRAQVVGALVRAALSRGELSAELHELSKRRLRPPASKTTRSYSVPTLQRWYYAYKRGGLDALKPKRRKDAGHGRVLSDEERQLLLDIRREHPAVSAPVILRTLIADGRLTADKVSAYALRRLYASHGLDRRTLRLSPGGKVRLRWQAERPNALWHGDVCYGAPLVIDDVRHRVRIHGLLDDASRYVLALEAHHTEVELDMLHLLVGALRRHGRPGTLYLDNGSTYRGDLLEVFCARLGIALVHARPADPQARAKMERFWGTLRRGCLDHLGSVGSLHDINTRMWAFLDQHYHRAPHAGLMGRTPASVWEEAAAQRVEELDEPKLKEAMTVRSRRRIGRDTTVSVRGQVYEVAAGYLAGAIVDVGYCLLDRPLAPWVEHQGKVLPLRLVDAVANSRRRRPAAPVTKPAVPFDPAGALLDRASGRSKRRERKEDN
jgi:putative transposase